ncbi:hypothetical protein TNCV_2592341 [Trichonephila clavipes]|nr:hypothetical protein TNCV_2592341 [Trichonephila clavipes]
MASANDMRTCSPWHDEFRGPGFDTVEIMWHKKQLQAYDLDAVEFLVSLKSTNLDLGQTRKLGRKKLASNQLRHPAGR